MLPAYFFIIIMGMAGHSIVTLGSPCAKMKEINFISPKRDRSVWSLVVVLLSEDFEWFHIRFHILELPRDTWRVTEGWHGDQVGIDSGYGCRLKQAVWQSESLMWTEGPCVCDSFETIGMWFPEQIIVNVILAMAVTVLEGGRPSSVKTSSF